MNNELKSVLVVLFTENSIRRIGFLFQVLFQGSKWGCSSMTQVESTAWISKLTEFGYSEKTQNTSESPTWPILWVFIYIKRSVGLLPVFMCLGSHRLHVHFIQHIKDEITLWWWRLEFGQVIIMSWNDECLLPQPPITTIWLIWRWVRWVIKQLSFQPMSSLTKTDLDIKNMKHDIKYNTWDETTASLHVLTIAFTIWHFLCLQSSFNDSTH